MSAELSMRVSTLLIADHAEAVNGKMYVTGGCWNRLTVANLPASHPHLTVATALHVPWSETNQRHTITLNLIDQDGQSVIPQPIEGEFETGRPAGLRPGDDQVIAMTFNFNGLSFESEGDYTFVLAVDGTELERIGFKLVVMQSAPVTG